MDKNLKNMLWSKSKPAEEWVGSFLSIPTLDAIELIENYERKKGNAISTPNEFKDCECDACNNRDLSSTNSVPKDDLCLDCGFMQSHHTDKIRKRNKKEGEPYPCKLNYDKNTEKETCICGHWKTSHYSDGECNHNDGCTKYESSTSCVNCGHLKQWHKEDKCIGQVFAKPCCECKGYLENTFSALKRNLPLEICDDLFQAIGYVSVMKGHPILKEKMARIDKILTDDLENTNSALGDKQ